MVVLRLSKFKLSTALLTNCFRSLFVSLAFPTTERNLVIA